MPEPKPRLFVKPSNPEFRIKDPDSKIELPSGGGEVPDNQFWQRRILNKDVVLVPVAVPVIEAAPAPAVDAVPAEIFAVGPEDATPVENKHKHPRGK